VVVNSGGAKKSPSAPRLGCGDLKKWGVRLRPPSNSKKGQPARRVVQLVAVWTGRLGHRIRKSLEAIFLEMAEVCCWSTTATSLRR
jgi:hypothetical protein